MCPHGIRSNVGGSIAASKLARVGGGAQKVKCKTAGRVVTINEGNTELAGGIETSMERNTELADRIEAIMERNT